MLDWFQGVIAWYMGHINYLTITLLMAIESSFIPFPSEVVVPPAGWIAAQGGLNLGLVIFFGTLGSIIGGLVNYYLSYFLGRPIIYKLADTKIAHLLLINRESIEKAEKYFNTHGKSSTFIGRLVPAIRQLISIPAGLAKMNVKDFLLFTFLGSAIWNAILAVLGFFLYSQKALLDKFYKEFSVAFLVLGVLFVGYLVFSAFRKNGKKKKSGENSADQ